jgi:hypothetical protein
MNELFTIARNEIHAKLFEEYKRFFTVLSLHTHLFKYYNLINATPKIGAGLHPLQTPSLTLRPFICKTLIDYNIVMQ